MDLFLINFNKTFCAKTSKIPVEVMIAPITEATIKVTDLDGNVSTYAILPTGATITYDSINDTTDASVTYKIINTLGYELPSTGGPGEEGLMLAGGMMVIGAAVLLIRRFTARIR